MSSHILKLTDLDYIIPSQSKESKIEIESDGSYVELTNDGTKKSLEKAKITLNDCLACSGCITSAESVLITAQSVTEFLANIGKDKIIVLSLSPQSRASLAAHFKTSILTVVKKLNTFLKSIGVNYLFDTSFSRDFSLLESSAEFVARYRKQIELPTPMLASACPGWICYAEKTHGDYILPYISTTKSPQQIMGTLVKYHFSKLIGKQPSEIYHTTVMPCYDKKLEASRNDFYSDIYKTKDVDCVLSTTEILDLLKEKQVDFETLEETSLGVDGDNNSSIYSNIVNNEIVYGIEGSSGGYLEYIFKYAAKELFGVVVDKVEYKVGRNPDFKETTLEVDGKKVLTFAQAYGFRNIQNIVRKIKMGKFEYDFVEIMACPSGCINGGAQIKVEGGSVKENKELLQQAELLYNQQSIRNPSDNPTLIDIYKLWLNGCFSENSKTLLHTQYHRIEKNINALNIKW
eukprot:gene1547-1954_t